MSKLEWRSVSGRELQADPSLSGVAAMVPESAGVYAWARAFRAPAEALDSPSVFYRWVTDELSMPIGRVGPIAVRHWGTIEEFTLGGRHPGSDKLATLSWVSENRQLRRAFIKAVEGCSGFGPTLYVGEASNLAQRTFQHLNGETDFAVRLAEVLNLDVNSLALRFIVLPAGHTPDEPRPKAFRSLIEDVVTRSTLGSLVDRIG